MARTKSGNQVFLEAIKINTILISSLDAVDSHWDWAMLDGMDYLQLRRIQWHMQLLSII